MESSLLFENDWFNLEANEYHALKQYISSHDILYASRSGAHYVHRMQEETDAKKSHLAFGAAFHLYFLEPHKYKQYVHIMPDVDRRTKEGKEKYNSFTKQLNKESIIINQEQDERIASMTLSLLRKNEVKKLTDGALYETSGFFNESDNVGFKIRPDIYKEGRFIVDLKTVMDARNFFSDCIRFGYFLQAYHYLRVASLIDECKYKEFYWICVEKDAPHEVLIYKANYDFLESKVLNTYAIGLSNILNYRETQCPKGYHENIIELNDNYTKQDAIYYEIF